MTEVTLPSGRKVNVKARPSWGDWLAADNAGRAAERDGDGYGNARATELMARMSDLARDEVMALDFDDADALAGLIRERTRPREVAEEAPFVKSSPSSSAAGKSKARHRRS
jgi:hypothetical protein